MVGFSVRKSQKGLVNASGLLDDEDDDVVDAWQRLQQSEVLGSLEYGDPVTEAGAEVSR